MANTVAEFYRIRNIHRQLCRTDVFALAKVLSYPDITPKVHQPIVDILPKLPGGQDVETSPGVWEYRPYKEIWQMSGPREFLVLYPRGHLKCISRNEKIQVSNGIYKDACDLIVGDKVLSMQDDYTLAWKSIQAIRHNESQPCVEVTFRSGRVLTVSDNHPIRLLYGYKDASLLVSGDRVAVAGNIKPPDANLKICYASILGWFLGDGNFCGQTVTNSDAKLRDDIIEAAEDAGGEAIHSYPKDRTSGVRVRKLRPLFESLGLLHKKAGNKFVPKIIFSGDNNSVASLLRSLFAADGTCSDNTGISLTTKSKQLAKDVQRLLHRFDIFSKVSQFKCNGFWHVALSSETMVRRFFDNIGWLKSHTFKFGKKSNPNINTIPREWRRLLPRGFSSVGQKHGMRKYDVCNHYATSKEKVLMIAEYINSETLKKLAADDIYWDDVINVKPVGLLPTVDIQVDGGNFAVSDVITHNTSLVSQTFLVQFILNWPNIRVLLSCATGDQAERVVRAIRGIFQYNDEFRTLFPEYCPQNADEFGSSQQFVIPARKIMRGEPTLFAVTVGKTIAGYHPDVIFHSDLVDKENVKTPGGINDVNNHFDFMEPLLERYTAKDGYPATRGFTFVEGTPYDFGDLHNKLMVAEGWEKVIKPAQENYPHGAILWPERFPQSELDRLCKKNQWLFSGQYLMKCVPQGDGLCDPKDVAFVSPDVIGKLMPTFRIHCTIDLAGMENTRTGDYTVLTIGGFDRDGRLYIFDIRWGHFPPEEVIAHIFNIHKMYPQIIDFKIEKEAHARVLLPFLQREMSKRQTFPIMVPIKRDNQKSKQDRIRSLRPWFKTSIIRFSDSIPAAVKLELLSQIGKFPSQSYGVHDDILDTLADMMQNSEGGVTSDVVADPPDMKFYPFGKQPPRDKFMGFDDDGVAQWLYGNEPSPTGGRISKTGFLD